MVCLLGCWGVVLGLGLLLEFVCDVCFGCVGLTVGCCCCIWFVAWFCRCLFYVVAARVWVCV